MGHHILPMKITSSAWEKTLFTSWLQWFIPLDPILTMTSTRKHLVEILPLEPMAHFSMAGQTPPFFAHKKKTWLVCLQRSRLVQVCLQVS